MVLAAESATDFSAPAEAKNSEFAAINILLTINDKIFQMENKITYEKAYVFNMAF